MTGQGAMHRAMAGNPVAFSGPKTDEPRQTGRGAGTMGGKVMAAVTLVLSGTAVSAEQAQPAWLTPLPSTAEITAASFAAMQIAAYCSERFATDKSVMDKVSARIDAAYKAAGRGTLQEAYTAARADRARSAAELKRLTTLYHRDNPGTGTSTKRDVWCPQGEKEMAKGSLVSQFLIAKGGS